jgi:segregation and condensation protein B
MKAAQPCATTGNNKVSFRYKRVKMSLKAKVEAIIYAAEDPVTLEQMSLLLKDVVLADLASAQENLAIEQADWAAEAEALVSEEANAKAKAEESELLPELALESAELICSEPGPVMPENATSQTEGSGENAANEERRGEALSEGDAAPEPEPENRALDAEAAHDQSAAAPDETLAPIKPSSANGEATPTGPAEPTPAEWASVAASETTSRKRQPKKTEKEIAEDKAVRARVREVLIELVTDYANEDRGMEIRQVAGGFRMATKPEHHDVVRAFAKSLKPPIRLSLAALETLAVIAYKQPVTGPEIADIRGVESASVLGTLLDRKLITTAGRKQVIGRPMQYKTSKDFLMRFGLNDVNELPSMEEFSQLASDGTIEIAPTEPQESLSLFESEAQSHEAGFAEDAAEDAASPDAESPKVESAETENPAVPENLEAHDQGTSLPGPQETAAQSRPSNPAEAVDSQPQSDAESSNVPEAEHPVGH